MKIENTNNDQITKENIETESLVKIVLESFDPSAMFHSEETFEKARAFYLETGIHEKLMNITQQFDALTKEYSDEAIINVFRDVINTDHQVFFDIMTAAFLITTKFDDKKFIQCMYDMCDLINTDQEKLIEENIKLREEINKSNIEDIDDLK